MQTEHQRFMALAIEEARSGLRAGERPFGSVVVRDGEVVGRARNLQFSTVDLTAHAEILALRDAGANLKQQSLPGCTLYTTCDPCPMCGGAILFAEVDTLVIGARDPDLRGVTTKLFDSGDYAIERLVEITGKKLEIVTGVMTEECKAIYRDWQEQG